MKHLLAFLCAGVLCLPTIASANPDTTFSPGVNAYPFGINWLTTDHRLAGGNWAQVMDSVCGFNTHHVGGLGGGPWSSDTSLNPPGWSWRSKSKLIAIDNNLLSKSLLSKTISAWHDFV